MIRRRTIGACFLVAFLLAAASVSAAGPGQSTSATSSSSAAPKKSVAHKRKHYTKHQAPGQKAPTPDRISEIQSALARGGYYQGDPTGKLDSGTVASIQKFQSANGLDSTGRLDASTLQRLGLGSDIAGVGAPKPVVPSCCLAPASSTSASSKPATTCCSTPSTSSSQPPSPAGASAKPASSAAPLESKPAQ